MVRDPQRPTTIEDALQQFLLQGEANGRSQHTLLQYKRHVLLLADWLMTSGEGTALARLTPEAVARFMVSADARNRADGKPKKATALNTLRSSVRCFCVYLHEAGLVPMNPGRLLKRALCSSRRSRALDADEIQRLRAVLLQAAVDEQGRRDQVLFELMLGTGIRIGSAIALDAEDVCLERGELALRGAKGGRVERAILPTRLEPLLANHLAELTSGPVFRNRRGLRLTVRHANRRLVEHFRRADIRRVSGTHVLRHSFATGLYRRTGDVLLVQRALCHRSLSSTLIYATPQEDRLREAVAPS